MFCVIAQDGLRDGRFQVVDFDAQQLFDEWLRDVFVAKNESEHDRIGNVKIIKRLYVHNYTSIKFRGYNLQQRIFEKRNLVNFANNR